MPTETLAPDAIISSTNLSGSVTDIDEPISVMPVSDLTLWLETKGPGNLRGATSGTYSGQLDDEAAVLAALEGDEFLSQWTDQSASALHFTQATTSAQPAWLADSENAFTAPGIDFDGTNHRLASGTGIDLSGGVSCAVVFEADDVTTAQVLFQTTHANSRFTVYLETTSLRPRLFDGAGTGIAAVKSGTVSAGTLYIMQYIYASGVTSMWLNGAAQSGTGSSVSNSTVGSVIGDRLSAAKFNGRIAAVLVKAGDWSAQRTDLDQYLAQRYGVTI